MRCPIIIAIDLYSSSDYQQLYSTYIASYYYDHGRVSWEDIIIIDRSSHEFLFTKTVCWDRVLFSPIFCAQFVHISVRNYCQPLLHILWYHDLHVIGMTCMLCYS